MADINRAIKRLVQALNTRNYNLLYSKRQFMGKEGLPHNLFVVSQAYWDAERGKYSSRELYSTTSLARMALFLRDMWYEEEGLELPTDNEMWNKIRKQLKEES